MNDFIQETDGQTDYATLLVHSVESALRGPTEAERGLIAVSTISVVSRFDEVCLDFLCSSV